MLILCFNTVVDVINWTVVVLILDRVENRQALRTNSLFDVGVL